ncbi:phosphoribosyltransferase [Streptomyces malaysiensis]|uniref:Phosphoribosyltransferase family protein n=1 Tax=Streptomyces malaysiensis subsp. samsunensis TaxID=459658 RepID=A0A9X2LUT0_STRMQ|nr:phosphoribosyltransferase family protein [Streptomyces samsunensis]MCQ8829883.1 phosphoribosyltransferase family protein [Streptomyces samsunensis]
MGEQRENLTYERFGVAVRELAQQVADDGYEPDIVLSIARGGVFVAGGLAYALDCKNIHLVNVEFYTGVGTTLVVPRKNRCSHHRDSLGMTFVVSSKSQCATPCRRSRAIPRTGTQCRTKTYARGDARRRPCGRI